MKIWILVFALHLQCYRIVGGAPLEAYGGVFKTAGECAREAAKFNDDGIGNDGGARDGVWTCREDVVHE